MMTPLALGKLASKLYPRLSSSATYFKPTSISLASLRANDGQPAFKSFTALPASRFEDVYYDTAPRNGSLAQQGMLLRRRTGLWQLVINASQTSSYEDLEIVQGRDAVEDALAQKLSWKFVRLGLGGTFDGKPSKGLKEVGRWFCTSEKFTVDGGCGIVVNETDFGHRAGMVKAGLEGAEVDGMVKEYAWAFPGAGFEGEGELKGLDDGKLDAFLESKGH